MKKFASSGLSIAIISAVLGGVAGGGAGHYSALSISEKNREATAVIRDIHEFELSLAEFHALISDFNLSVLETRRINEEKRQRVLKNLVHQHALLGHLELYFDDPRGSKTRIPGIAEYAKNLQALQLTILRAEQAVDYADAGTEIKNLLIAKEKLVHALRKRAGILPT